MKINILTIIVIIGILTVISPANANIINIHDVNIKTENTSILNNNNTPNFVKSPKKYSISKNYGKTKGFEKEKNIITTKKGKKYIFKTKYFLPVSWKNGGKNGKTEYWYNCQSIVINRKYMYILTSSGYNLNKGFIIRYNTKILDKYVYGKNMDKLRYLGAAMRDNKNLTKSQKYLLKKAIKVGPIFNVGHGQSLSYNPKTKSLWMWRDDKDKYTKQKLTNINMKTLLPKKTYVFSIIYNNTKLNELRNLAFDSKGNFYVDYTQKTKTNKLGSSLIFTGNIHKNNITMNLLTTLKNRPGTYSQSLSINRFSNRLYLVSDGVFYTLPIFKLRSYTLTNKDIQYSVFNTKREFEGISFDEFGNSYLLILRGSEVLKSTQK